MTAQADELPGVTTAPKPQGITAATILDALERHYRKPGEARDGEILIAEVSAPGSTRRADLVRIGMWASRGAGIDVHEIKVSRSDWLRELDDPAKAEAWWPHCNRFWVVTVPGVVQLTELPEGWGLMEMPGSGRRFKVRVPAQSRKDIRLTVPLMVELLRRADNQRLGEIGRLREEHRDDLRRREAANRERRDRGELSVAVKQRLDLLEAVEKALGMPLDTYGGWPKLPPQRITPAELAAYLAVAQDHVSVQRRAEDARRERAVLRDAATGLLKRLDAGNPS